MVCANVAVNRRLRRAGAVFDASGRGIPARAILPAGRLEMGVLEMTRLEIIDAQIERLELAGNRTMQADKFADIAARLRELYKRRDKLCGY